MLTRMYCLLLLCSINRYVLLSRLSEFTEVCYICADFHLHLDAFYYTKFTSYVDIQLCLEVYYLRWNFLRNPLHVNNESMKDSPRILILYRDLKVDHIMLYAEGNVKNQFGHFLMLSLIQTWTFSRNTSNITLQR